MENKILRLILSLLFVWSSILAANGQEVKEKLKAGTKSTSDASALLYQITGKNLQKPSYLFGTLHIVCTPDMFPMEKLNSFIDQTEKLVLEVNLSDPAEMQAAQPFMMIPNGKTLNDILTPAQLAKVDELLKNTTGAGVEQMKTVRPFMLQAVIMTSPKLIGCAQPNSYELTFIKHAVDKKLPIEGLETAVSEFEAIDSQPLEKQAAALYKMALNPEKTFADTKKLYETYKSQNSDALYELINSQMGDDKEFQTRLLDARNQSWIPKIERLIAEKPAFIAVGGGHLGGENGVINLLRAKGYKIQPIKL